MNSPVLIKDTENLIPVALSGERLADLQSLIRSNRFLPVPSRADIFVGDGDYIAIGTEFLGHFIELGGLRKQDRLLDIGCGIGRMAVPLTQYLDSSVAQYVGIDPASSGVGWCTKNVGSVYPNFRFVHLDIANELYNPGGCIDGKELALPFTSGSFDFAVMASVVTHLPAEEIAPYFKEIARVLDTGGRLFLSAFVIATDQPGETAPRLMFKRGEAGPAWYANADAPLAAVAFDDGYLDDALRASGLDVAVKRLGHWRGGNDARHYQDFFVAVKSARRPV